ncbi:hypothetical protein MNBD_GAMMA16-369 [hydrothermal vent metagenome]|uniref:Flagellar hook-length control protein-like C-terminal domain-containing protein n=1 Tax=hydrothermal vent metagenome TaxID=652676 RepID=A0A3B0ZM78_9ZZZZ
MRISFPPSQQSISLSEVKPALNNWKVGQTLQAIVVNPGKNNSSAITLKIGGHIIRAQNTQTPPVPPFKGQNLKLEVITLTPSPILKVLGEAKTDFKNEAVRNLLPRQAAYPPLLARLHTLSTTKATNTADKIPNSLQNMINRIVDRLPTQSSVSSPQGLKSDLRNSGIFLEQQALQQKNIADKPIVFSKDFKANLLTLAAEIKQQITKNERGNTRLTTPPILNLQALSGINQANKPSTSSPPTLLTPSLSLSGSKQTPEGKPLVPPLPSTEKTIPPPPMRHTPVVAQGRVLDSAPNLPGAGSLLSELFELVDSGLSRLRLTQLANTQVDANNLVYLFELPVKNQNGIDLINLKLEQENSKQGNNKQQGWNITLAFDFEELGPVYAHIILRGKKVNTNITAEQGKTKLLFEKHIDKLKESLTTAGLEIDNICCSQGKPEQRNTKTHINPIVDTRA